MTEQNINIKDKLEGFVDSAHSLSEESISIIGELEVIFKSIKSLANEGTDIKRLASAGEYLAMDKANGIDCWREQIFTDVKKDLSA